MQTLSYRFINPVTGLSRFTAVPLHNISGLVWESGKEIKVYTVGDPTPFTLTFDSADKAAYLYNKFTENGIQC